MTEVQPRTKRFVNTGEKGAQESEPSLEDWNNLKHYDNLKLGDNYADKPMPEIPETIISKDQVMVLQSAEPTDQTATDFQKRNETLTIPDIMESNYGGLNEAGDATPKPVHNVNDPQDNAASNIRRRLNRALRL